MGAARGGREEHDGGQRSRHGCVAAGRVCRGWARSGGFVELIRIGRWSRYDSRANGRVDCPVLHRAGH